MTDEELLQAILVWVNDQFGGDIQMIGDLAPVYEEFAQAPREQVSRVLSHAREAGFVKLGVDAIQLTTEGVKRANAT